MISQLFFYLVPAVGLEPTRGYPQQILSLHRLPFRHAGILSCTSGDVQLYYYTTEKTVIQADFLSLFFIFIKIIGQYM